MFRTTVRALALVLSTLVLITGGASATHAGTARSAPTEPTPVAPRVAAALTSAFAHPDSDERSDFEEWLRERIRDREEERERRDNPPQPPEEAAPQPAAPEEDSEPNGGGEAGLGEGRRPDIEPPSEEAPAEEAPAEEEAPVPEEPSREVPQRVYQDVPVGAPEESASPSAEAPSPSATQAQPATGESERAASDGQEASRASGFADNPRVIVVVTLAILVAITAAVGVLHFASPFRRSRH